MPSNIMPEVDAVAAHLSYNSQPVATSAAHNVYTFSGFIAGLRDARETTGRDPENGGKVVPAKHGSWLGTVGYMALLDQIGACFKPANTVIVQGNCINKALSYFSTLSTDEISALYALRCAFAHDYSLHNKNIHQSLQHRFAVYSDGNSQVVALPSLPWDGDLANDQQSNTTLINLQAFGDLVEQVYDRIKYHASQRELEIVLPGGSDELILRYSFLVPRPVTPAISE